MKFVSVFVLSTLLASSSFAEIIEWSNAAGDRNYNNPKNWSSGNVPSGAVVAKINGKSVFPSGESLKLDGVNVGDGQKGELGISGGRFVAMANAGRKSHVGLGNGGEGVVKQVGGEVTYNTLILGAHAKAKGSYLLAGGSLIIARGAGDSSLLVGSKGKGTFIVAGGSLETRTGVTLGGGGSLGVFSVKGGKATKIAIGSRNSGDGVWNQSRGSILNPIVETNGLTKIFIDDSDDDGTGGDVSFEKGSVLDVRFYGTPRDGEWVVMEWEGKLLSKGLALRKDDKAAGWSMEFRDTGVNGKTKGPDTLVIRYKAKK